jgi:hypothetical protein
MAYMNQEKKATIAIQANPILKKYGIKATFAVRNHSTIVVNIKSGALDFIGNYNAQQVNKAYGETPHLVKDYMDVNPYWYQEHFTGEVLKFFTELFAAVKSADWFNKSDAMTDYFHTAYYFDINVGQWNKAYELTK